MAGLEDVLGVAGFWLFLILLIFRTPLKEKLMNAAPKPHAEIAEMKTRMQELEARVNSMGAEILELQDLQDFDRKLLGKTAKPSALSSAAKSSLTSTSGVAGRTTLPLKK